MHRRAAPLRSVAPIVALGAVPVVGTAWFAWSLPAAASRRSRPGAALAEEVGPWRWAYDHLAPPSSPRLLAVVLLSVAGAMFAAWAAVIALTWRRSSPARVRAVVGCVGVACAIGVFALPSHSSDIYDYALFGRIGSVHGGQPYHDLPDAYPDDPLYRYSSHQYTGHRDNKLPVWTLVATGVAGVSGDRPLVTLLAFRGLLALSTFLGTVLVARLAGRLSSRAAASAAAVYGLCPVTLVYGGAKTDALMVLLMLVGLALLTAGRGRLGTAVIALAVMVKAIAAPVLALAVLGPTERDGPGRAGRWLQVSLRAFVALAVVVAVYLPFRHPYELFRAHLAEPDQTSAAALATPAAVAVLVALVGAVAAWAWLRSPGTAIERADALVKGSALVLVVFAVILSRPGLPWYLLTPLAVVALARSLPLLLVTGSLAGTSFVMGWWESIDTRAHPLPELDLSRSGLYLVIAATGVAAALVLARARRRRTDGARPAGCRWVRPPTATTGGVAPGGSRPSGGGDAPLGSAGRSGDPAPGDGGRRGPRRERLLPGVGGDRWRPARQ